MQTIKDNKSLAEAIAHLENVQVSEGHLLKQHFNFTIENLSPLHMIKEKFNETFHSPDLKSNLLNGALTLGTNLLANQFIVGSSGGWFRKILGNIVQNNLPKFTIDSPEELKKSGISFLKNTLTKMKLK